MDRRGFLRAMPARSATAAWRVRRQVRRAQARYSARTMSLN